MGSNPTGHPIFKIKENKLAIYEYKCDKCEHEFIEEQNIVDTIDVTQCPKCNHKAQKQISLSSFTMTGYASINGYSKGNVKR